MESAAFKKLTEQLTEIVQYVRLAKMAFQENLTGKGLKPMLTNDDAAKMLGVSKRTLQRMRSENRIDFIKIGNQCRYQVEAIERMVEERTIAKETSVRPSALGRERPYPGTRPDSTLQQPVLGRTVPPLVSQHGGTLARQYRQEICQQRLPLIGRCTRHPQKHLLPKHRPARAACLLYGQHRLLAQARRRTLPQPFCAHQHR